MTKTIQEKLPHLIGDFYYQINCRDGINFDCQSYEEFTQIIDDSEDQIIIEDILLMDDEKDSEIKGVRFDLQAYCDNSYNNYLQDMEDIQKEQADLQSFSFAY